MKGDFLQFGHINNRRRMGLSEFDFNKKTIAKATGNEGGFCGIVVSPGRWNYWFFMRSQGDVRDLEIMAEIERARSAAYGGRESEVTEAELDKEIEQEKKESLIRKRRAAGLDDEGFLVLNPKRKAKGGDHG